MKLYHFPSPNPQKVTFALLELGLDCEKIPVDLTKGDHREPAFSALPASRRSKRISAPAAPALPGRRHPNCRCCNQKTLSAGGAPPPAW
jgi:hypothetical protein